MLLTAGMFLEDYSAYVMIAGYWLTMGMVLTRSFAAPFPLVMAVLFIAFGRTAMPVARRVLLSALPSARWAAAVGSSAGRITLRPLGDLGVCL